MFLRWAVVQHKSHASQVVNMPHQSLSTSTSMLLLLFVAIFSSCSLAVQLCGGADGTQYRGLYIDGSGTFIAQDNVTRPYEFPLIRNCWCVYFWQSPMKKTDQSRYDTYAVNASLYNEQWRKSTGDIYCGGTYTCTVSSLNDTEVCQTRSSSLSINVGLTSPKVVIRAPGGVGGGAQGGTAEVDVSYTLSLSSTGCYSASDTKACQ